MKDWTILIPIDGSEGALTALRFGADLAEKLGAKVTLFHVYNMTAASAVGLTALSRQGLQETMERISSGHFAVAKEAIADRAIEVDTRVEIGNPSEEIVSHASRNGISMIVMGSRGMTTFQALYMGSVSSQVVAHAKCPVTVVR